MATVYLAGALRELAGGTATVQIDAPRIHELIALLGERFPRLAEPLRGMAVAIDGQIYHRAGYEPLAPDSEVHFLPPISGG